MAPPKAHLLTQLGALLSPFRKKSLPGNASTATVTNIYPEFALPRISLNSLICQLSICKGKWTLHLQLLETIEINNRKIERTYSMNKEGKESQQSIKMRYHTLSDVIELKEREWEDHQTNQVMVLEQDLFREILGEQVTRLIIRFKIGWGWRGEVGWDKANRNSGQSNITRKT